MGNRSNYPPDTGSDTQQLTNHSQSRASARTGTPLDSDMNLNGVSWRSGVHLHSIIVDKALHHLSFVALAIITILIIVFLRLFSLLLFIIYIYLSMSFSPVLLPFFLLLFFQCLWLSLLIHFFIITNIIMKRPPLGHYIEPCLPEATTHLSESLSQRLHGGSSVQAGTLQWTKTIHVIVYTWGYKNVFMDFYNRDHSIPSLSFSLLRRRANS